MSSFCLLLRFKWLPWQPPQYPRLPPNIFWYPWVSLTYVAWWHNSSRKLSFEQVFDTLMPDYIVERQNGKRGLESGFGSAGYANGI